MDSTMLHASLLLILCSPGVVGFDIFAHISVNISDLFCHYFSLLVPNQFFKCSLVLAVFDFEVVQIVKC